MKVKILKRHFDAAVSQPWSAETCLLSQAANDAGFKTTAWGISTGTQLSDLNVKAKRLMHKFDDAAYCVHHINRPALAKLRASLPITINISEEAI